MGAWGERSTDCDDVQDELDKHFNLQGSSAYAFDNVTKVLDKVKANMPYNPTLLVGVVLGVDEVAKVPVRHLRRAIADGKAALKDPDYIRTWVRRKARLKTLSNEVRLLQRRLKVASVDEPKLLRRQIANHQRWLRDNPMCAGQTDPTNSYADRARAAITDLKKQLKEVLS